MSDRRLHDATLHAEMIVRDENLALPIDLFALAKSRGILVEAKPSAAKGVSGMGSVRISVCEADWILAEA